MASEAELFEVQVQDAALIAGLDELARRMQYLTPVMQEIGEIGLTSIAKNFEVGGRYSEPGNWRGGSRKWRPLSAATLFGSEGLGSTRRNRKKAFFKLDGTLTKRGQKRLNKKILIESGTLMNSINANATSDSVQWGTNMIYAAIHNFGGKAGRGQAVTIPARPYLVLQEEDLAEINEVINDYLTGAIQ